MRVHSVKRALKEGLVCSKCNEPILKGGPYVWIKPRHGTKRVRHAGSQCAFRDSELTSSDKLARVYDERDSAREQVNDWDGTDVSDLLSILLNLSEAVREVAEEYEESASNIEQAFPNGTPTSDECREKSEELFSWADELESASFDEHDEDAEDSADDWADEQRQAATDLVDGCPV